MPKSSRIWLPAFAQATAGQAPNGGVYPAKPAGEVGPSSAFVSFAHIQSNFDHKIIPGQV